MSRHLITANKSIFAGLDEYCRLRDQVLANAGSARWITSLPQHRHFMLHASVGEKITFNARRSLAVLNVDDRSFVGAVGFEGELHLDDFKEVELDAGHLTVILSELKPRPKATPAEVRDVVEGFDKNADPEYSGHDPMFVAGLYPPIRIFQAVAPLTSPWNTFFKLCVDEGESVGMWSDIGIANALKGVCDREPERIPYQILCRSIFDGDPTSLYLALYRCLERLYSYSSSKELIHALNIDREWDVVAAALEDTLSWYPKEEGSLTKLLSLANRDDIRNFFSSLGEAVPSDDQLPQQAARRIYLLRNSIVHYRPSQSMINIDNYEWDAMIQSMAKIVLSVYMKVFGTI